MDTQSIKTSELTGPALRYAVLTAIGWQRLGAVGVTSEAEYTEGVPLCKMGHNEWWRDPNGDTWCAPCEGLPEPDRDWSQAGPLIEREKIGLVPFDKGGRWSAEWSTPTGGDDYEGHSIEGDTALIAACRAIAASHWGEYADIPSELVQEQSDE